MGAKLVIIEEEAKMAALEAGINIDLPQGNLVIDIGGGTCDLAIISSGDIVVSRSIKVADNHFDDDILNIFVQNTTSQLGKKPSSNVA